MKRGKTSAARDARLASAQNPVKNRASNRYDAGPASREDRPRAMTMDRSAAEATALEPAPENLPTSVRRSIFLYLGLLILLLAFGGPSGGLIDVPISFFLKNRLHLEAHEVARFRLIASIPLYLSFVFGFIRDIWNPLGMRDRGFMLLFGGLTALLYVLLAFTPMSYATLAFAVVALTA